MGRSEAGGGRETAAAWILPLRSQPLWTGGQNRWTLTRVTRVVTGRLLECHGAGRRASTGLQAASLHHSLTSDLNLSGEVCFPFGNVGIDGEEAGLVTYQRHTTGQWSLCGSRPPVVLSNTTVILFFFCGYLTKGRHWCEGNNQQVDRLFFVSILCGNM